jgi:hypothetical protein
MSSADYAQLLKTLCLITLARTSLRLGKLRLGWLVALRSPTNDFLGEFLNSPLLLTTVIYPLTG